MRFIGNFQEKNKPNKLKRSLHPWIFQALLQKFETDPKKFFFQALVYDRQYFRSMHKIRDEGIDSIIDAIKINMQFLGSRGVYFQALHDGFYLNYVEGVTPSECKKNLKRIKKELSEFYNFIQNISPETIHFLLVGSSYVDFDCLLAFFEFLPYKFYDNSGYGNDESIIFIGNDFNKEKMYRNSIQFFIQTLKEWCFEENQEKIRDFLNYITEVPNLPPIINEKWKVAFDFSAETIPYVYWFSCEKTLRSPLFDSLEDCKNILLSTIENNKKDPTYRDIVDVENME